MRIKPSSAFIIATLSFAAGIGAANLPAALAETNAASNLSNRTFMVSIDEVKNNFVFSDRFKGTYKKTLTMSDGSTRIIKLTPMAHPTRGWPVVELSDNGGVTYMGLNGTTTNGKLMIQVRDLDELRRQLKEQGFPAE